MFLVTTFFTALLAFAHTDLAGHFTASNANPAGCPEEVKTEFDLKNNYFIFQNQRFLLPSACKHDVYSKWIPLGIEIDTHWNTVCVTSLASDQIKFSDEQSSLYNWGGIKKYYQIKKTPQGIELKSKIISNHKDIKLTCLYRNK